MQKVLVMSTYDHSLRSGVDGWSHEDADYVQKAYRDRLNIRNVLYHDPNSVPVGLIGGSSCVNIQYPTVLHALGDGWKLLAPPQKREIVTHTDDNGNPVNKVEMWEWWLTKD